MNPRLFYLFCVFGVTFVGGCGKEPANNTPATTTVRLGIVTWAGFATAFVGTEEGFFGDKLKVDAKVIDDMPARHAAFQSGAIDVMITSIDGFAQEAAQGLPGKLFLITDESWGGDGIVCKSEINSIKDLQNKRVAFARATPSHYLLLRALNTAGLDGTAIDQVKVDDPGRAADAFLGGTVDAAVTWEPFLSDLQKTGKGRILLTSKDYPDIIVDGLVASDRLGSDEATIRQFVAGWLKSVEYIKANPDSAASIMAKKLNVSVEQIKVMMSGLRFADRARNRYFFDNAEPARTLAAKLFDEASLYWKKAGVVENPVPGASRVSPIACKYFNEN